MTATVHSSDLDPAVIAPYADSALATGRAVRFGALLLVPDVALTEALANGRHLPAAPILARQDGRSVHVYAVPGGDAR